MSLSGPHSAPLAGPNASGSSPAGPLLLDQSDASSSPPRNLRWHVRKAQESIVGALSFILLLSIAVTLPVVQLVALGALLQASARVARTGRLREAFVGIPEAARLGKSAFALWVLTAPCRLFISLREDALLLDPMNKAARGLFVFALLAGFFAILVGTMGIYQGGNLRDFIHPIRGIRRLRVDAGDGQVLLRTWNRAREFIRVFEIPSNFWLGIRGYLGAAAWLFIPSTLLVVGRTSPLPILGGLLFAVAIVRVPFLQVHFAVHNDLDRMFDASAEMDLFSRAPLSFLIAIAATLLLSLPLYLLKIELVPRDALWLPAAVFLITIFPLKLMTAYAYHRALRRPLPAHLFWQWFARILMVPIALLYAVIVFVTPLTGWHGLLGLYEHHAFLLPVPF